MGRAIDMENDISALKIKVERLENQVRGMVSKLDEFDEKSTKTSYLKIMYNTEIETDQGIVKSQNLTKENTIENRAILHVKKINSQKKYILIKEDLLNKGVPEKKMILSGEHEIDINNNNFIQLEKLTSFNNLSLVRNNIPQVLITIEDDTPIFLNKILVKPLQEV